MNDIKKVIDHIKAGLDCVELVELLSHANQSVRGSGMNPRANHSSHDANVVIDYAIERNT
jgi:hypothetical protein